MGKSKKQQRVVVQASSSETSSFEAPPTSDFMNPSIWAEAFDLTGIGENLRKHLTTVVPFLLGDAAHYNVDFFHDVGGLSMSGVPFKRLKEEHNLPLEAMVGTYPLNKNENRHPLRHMTDDVAARALRMYQRVYGGTAPDNGEFGTAFVRGLMLDAKRWKINWAEGAAEIAKSRLKSPVLNPGKLTPPCLREQIQAMLKLFRAVVDKMVRKKNAAAKAISEGGVPRPVGIQRQPRSAAPLEEARRKSPLGRLNVMVKGPTEATHQTPPTSLAQPRERKLTERSVDASLEKPSGQGSEQLRKQRFIKEAALVKVKDELEHAEISLAMRETNPQELLRLEQSKWEEFAGIQQSKHGMVLDDASKKVVDTRLRSLMEDAVAVSTKLSTLVPEISHWTLEAANLRSQLTSLQESVNDLSARIDVLVVQESCIRPQQFYSAFPVNLDEMVPLKMNLPCAECGRYWADMALVNLPCGCLFHPSCLFQVALSSKPCCPGCNTKPSVGWMGQWGFKSNLATAEATSSAVNRSGWAPPLTRIEAMAITTKRKIVDASPNRLSSPKRLCHASMFTKQPDVEEDTHIALAPDIPPRAAMGGVNTDAVTCDLTLHSKLQVEVGEEVASASPHHAPCTITAKGIGSDTVIHASQCAVSSGRTEPTDAQETSRDGTVDETTRIEYGDILNIASAAAAEAIPTTPS